MPMTTIIECDVCRKEFKIKDHAETPGAEEILQITDAMTKKYFFCTVSCLLKWLEKYKCPYKEEPSPLKGDIDEFLPGLN